MSRIGKLPIKIPEGVTVKIENNIAQVTGPKGTLTQEFAKSIIVEHNQNVINVSTKGKNIEKALHGLYRSLINNMIYGVTTGWSKTLELTGVGYKSQMVQDDLVLNLGFSHQIKFPRPQGIAITVLDKEGRIVIEGIDKQLVGETAAKIRRLRPPEPYKGKGIHYLGEKIKRKAGKSTKAAGGVGAK